MIVEMSINFIVLSDSVLRIEIMYQLRKFWIYFLKFNNSK